LSGIYLTPVAHETPKFIFIVARKSGKHVKDLGYKFSPFGNGNATVQEWLWDWLF
jgi:hypothetical protein